MQNKKHTSYYLVTAVIQLLVFVLVLYSMGNKALQLTYVVFGTVFYIGWSLLHHHIHHDLHPKVVLEYVLMGLLGITIVFFLLQ